MLSSRYLGGRIDGKMTPEVIASHILEEFFCGDEEYKIIIVEKNDGPVWNTLRQIIDEKRYGWGKGLIHNQYRIYYTYDEWKMLRIKPDADSHLFEGFLVWPSWLVFVLIGQPTIENMEVITGYLWHSPRVKIIKFGEEYATN